MSGYRQQFLDLLPTFSEHPKLAGADLENFFAAFGPVFPLRMLTLKRWDRFGRPFDHRFFRRGTHFIDDDAHLVANDDSTCAVFLRYPDFSVVESEAVTRHYSVEEYLCFLMHAHELDAEYGSVVYNSRGHEGALDASSLMDLYHQHRLALALPVSFSSGRFSMRAALTSLEDMHFDWRLEHPHVAKSFRIWQDLATLVAKDRFRLSSVMAVQGLESLYNIAFDAFERG